MNRIELLNKLLNQESSVDFITEKLEEFGWDSPKDLVLMRKVHLINALNNYLNGKLSKSEIEDWANAIESREDVGFEADSEDLIREVIYELANPYLTEDLTKERAIAILNNLKK